MLRSILAADKDNAKLRQAVKGDAKGKLSILIYLAGAGLAFVNPWIAISLYLLVTVIWFMPERRLEAISENT